MNNSSYSPFPIPYEKIMKLLEIFESSLQQLVAIAKFFLEGISVLCIIIGFVQTLKLAFSLSHRHNSIQSFNKIRLRFGMWLALALEFQLEHRFSNSLVSQNTYRQN